MPIYGFHCEDCGKEFQTLVRSGERATCPSCNSERLERQLSLIARPASGGEDAGSMTACGSGASAAPCGMGACRFAGGECG